MGTLLTLLQAEAAAAGLRHEGKRLVFTNGHFDLMHVGHLDYLERARALGDALFIGINGDTSTRHLKGAGRPLVPASERARLIAALECVSAAVIFEEDTATSLIMALRPAVYVKGGDYAGKAWPERDFVVGYGGEVALIPYLPDHSTSALIARIRALPDAPTS
jgi:D-glycero-beta-D-manno-heptose 1-phosphate adenylyltransferase